MILPDASKFSAPTIRTRPTWMKTQSREKCLQMNCSGLNLRGMNPLVKQRSAYSRKRFRQRPMNAFAACEVLRKCFFIGTVPAHLLGLAAGAIASALSASK
jgi:hypothetical protein